MTAAPYAPAVQERGDLLPRVLHLDHSTEAGGAELALLRLLTHATSWVPTLRIPAPQDGAGIGVFESLRSQPGITLDLAGTPQRSGATNKGLSPMRVLSFAFGTIVEAVRLRRSSGFASASVIHANTSRSAVYAAIACTFTSKRLVLHLRDMASAESLGSVGFLLYSRLALRRADGVIANSRSTLESAESHLRTEAFREVIPSPIGFDNRTELNLPGTAAEVRTIGMVARIDPWKGQALLLSAFAEACAESDIRLVLAGGAAFGKSADLDELKRLAAELGILSRVDFLGHVDDVRGVVEQMDICVQASIRPEPLGQNVLQYLVAGKPTIAVNAGGPAEWIENGRNGILVEMNSVQAMTEALRLLVSDDALRRKLAENAHGTVGIGSDAEIADAHGVAFASTLTHRVNR